MSEIHGPLTALAHAIVDPIEQHRRLPPDKQILAQVTLAVLFSSAFLGQTHAPDWWLPVGAWAGLSVLGVLWLLSAWRQARLYARRELGTAFGRLVLAGIFAGALWFRAYPEDWPLTAIILKGFYIAWGLSHVCRFLLAAQLFGGGNAERIIRRAVKRRTTPMIPARSHRGR